MDLQNSLTNLIADLEQCKEYDANHTLENAFRYLENLRTNAYWLALHLKTQEVELARFRDRSDAASKSAAD